MLAVKIGLFSFVAHRLAASRAGHLLKRMLTWRITLAAYLLWVPTAQGVIDGNVSLLKYSIILE